MSKRFRTTGLNHAHAMLLFYIDEDEWVKLSTVVIENRKHNINVVIGASVVLTKNIPLKVLAKQLKIHDPLRGKNTCSGT